MAELTLKTAKNTYKLLENSIHDFEKNADMNMSVLKVLDTMHQNENINIIKSILETSITLCFINLDISAAYRQYLSAQTHYEERYAMKCLNTIMSEGYKKIFGFTENKKSFWKQQIKRVIDKYPELHTEYDRITTSLSDLAKNNIFNKDMRDYSVHYDHDPRKVYDMLSKLSAEDVSDRFNHFYATITNITAFINKTINLAVTPFTGSKIK